MLNILMTAKLWNGKWWHMTRCWQHKRITRTSTAASTDMFILLLISLAAHCYGSGGCILCVRVFEIYLNAFDRLVYLWKVSRTIWACLVPYSDRLSNTVRILLLFIFFLLSGRLHCTYCVSIFIWCVVSANVCVDIVISYPNFHFYLSLSLIHLTFVSAFLFVTHFHSIENIFTFDSLATHWRWRIKN